MYATPTEFGVGCAISIIKKCLKSNLESFQFAMVTEELEVPK
jgi:hypothetical protein